MRSNPRSQSGEHASLPHFSSPFVEYNQRNATFQDDRATLSTVSGRVTVECVLPDDSRDTPHSECLFSDEYETTGATLHHREHGDEFHLHVRTKTDVDDPDPRENGTVLGVDLGAENVAVTSTGAFRSGDELDHWHHEYEKRRTSMQQRGTLTRRYIASGRKRQTDSTGCCTASRTTSSTRPMNEGAHTSASRT
jgi:hypothetical protein